VFRRLVTEYIYSNYVHLHNQTVTAMETHRALINTKVDDVPEVMMTFDVALPLDREDGQGFHLNCVMELCDEKTAVFGNENCLVDVRLTPHT